MLSRRAFTIVELLVVMAVIGVLIALTLPAMGMIRAQSRNTVCLSNLRQIFLPLRAYSDSIGGLMPMCAMLPAVGPNGPEGGLPQLLSPQVNVTSEIWLCPLDEDPESLATGTSFLYVPGLLRYTPEVQSQVVRTVLSQPNMTDKARLKSRHDLEGRMVNAFYQGIEKPPDPQDRGIPREDKYALVMDSADRHPGSRTPRNALFSDGTVRDNTPSDGDATEEESDG